MTIHQLRQKAEHHQAIANAYFEGIHAAQLARRETIRECLMHIECEVKHPRTCAHPSAKLSAATTARNKLAKSLMESIAKRFLAEDKANDDMPF